MLRIGDLVVVRQTMPWAEQLFSLIGEVTAVYPDGFRGGSFSVDFPDEGEILMYRDELDRY